MMLARKRPAELAEYAEAKGAKTLRKSDLLWLMAYPVYQLAGTFRHEASHALAALLEGAKVREFVFWPTVQEAQGLRWGYVLWDGRTSWRTVAAPYLIDLVTFAAFFWACNRLRFRRHWLWVNAVVVGLVSPLVNSLFNYGGSFGSCNDVSRLLGLLPKWGVHGYFVASITLYALGLWVVLGRSLTGQGERVAHE